MKNKANMEWKIGEIKQINGEWYQCVKAPKFGECDGCAFDKKGCPVINDKTGEDLLGYCSYDMREDNEEVIFKKLEKVGEPFYTGFYCSWVQKYKLYDNHAIGEYPKCHFGNNYVLIELKQNKENMEEKKIKLTKEEYDYIRNQIKIIILPGNTADDVDDDKLVNEIMDMFSIDEKHSNSEKIGKDLKEFDLEAAKAGKPVCTRDGRKARIICFDAEGNKPLIVLSKIDGKEVILRYTEKGQSDNFHSPTPREDDLMMLPEKKEGWVNIYKSDRPHKRDAIAIFKEIKECDNISYLFCHIVYFLNDGINNRPIFLYGKKGCTEYAIGKVSMFDEIKPATEEEKKLLIAKLAEINKKWNAETKQIEDVRWRAKEGEIYYWLTHDVEILNSCEVFDEDDDVRYEIGNYFKTYETAERVAKQIREIFKNSKAE